MSTRPPKIRPTHRSRRALVYRQSAAGHVRHNTGSAAVQRDLATTLHDWGWPENMIEIRDEDLGRSGSVADERTGVAGSGFRKLLEAIARGEVTQWVEVEMTRLARKGAKAKNSS